eukprot:gene9725-7598_t
MGERQHTGYRYVHLSRPGSIKYLGDVRLHSKEQGQGMTIDFNETAEEAARDDYFVKWHSELMDDTISLRPVTLRPGGPAGANAFAQFGKGSGFGIPSKKATAVTPSDTAAKRDGERIVYSKLFLLEFMERYNTCPVELQHLNAEFIIQEQSERDQQRAVLLKVAEEIEDRDWRTKDDSSAPAAATPSTKAAGPADKAPAKEAKPQPSAGKMQKAADMGREAYRPGAQVSGHSSRQIKGILNKLTPEKFERLLQQLLEVIVSADLLQHTIMLVFENAVEQLTYCAMYADLCLQLSKELPTFPPPDEESKPISFHQILLNTCQDEFEGTEAAKREMLAIADEPERNKAESAEMLAIADEAERNKAERAVKKRTLGNMRLMSELYKQEMVKDWIMCTCIESLLEKEQGKSLPADDNIEAAAEIIGTAGSKIAKSENAQTRAKLEDFFKQLGKFETDKNLLPRVRFLIRDLMDLRKANWVARREVFTAKKLEDVRAQAEAELGMVSSAVLTANLPTLPAQQRIGAVEDFALLPPLRAPGGDAQPVWQYKPSNPGQKMFTGNSALLGDYQPLPSASESPPAPAEELQRKTESLLSEFCSTLDKAEACTCVGELAAPGFMSRLVEIGLETIMNSMKEKEAAALEGLLLHFQSQGLVQQSDVVAGLKTYTEQLEDLSMDYPKAPGLLGHYIGSAVAQKLLPVTTLSELLVGDYSAEPKRALAEAAFINAKAGLGDAGLMDLCTTAGLKASAFLEAEPDLDGHLPSTADWLASAGLTAAVPL